MAGRGLLAAGALAAGRGPRRGRRAVAAAGERRARARRRAGGLRRRSTATCERRGSTTGRCSTSRSTSSDDRLPGDRRLTVVFAHGYALNLDSWHYQRQALRGRARLVFYDQRSHGRSQRAEFDTHHVDQLGRDLGSVIDAVAPTGPLMLVGHSMGGMTIMALAAQRPELFGERVFGVALIATTAGGLRAAAGPAAGRRARCSTGSAPSVAASDRASQGAGRELRWSDSDLGLLLTRLYSFGSTATDQASRFVASMVSATPIDVVAEFLPALQEHDKRDALGVFEGVELLVMVGRHRPAHAAEQSEEIVRRVPGAEFVVVADSGHMVTLEKHEEVDAHLIALLERVRRDIAPRLPSGAA